MKHTLIELEEAFYLLFRIMPVDNLMEHHDLICRIKELFESADLAQLT
jgi:hypothetical protein